MLTKQRKHETAWHTENHLTKDSPASQLENREPMNVPIRTIGIATTVFWTILILFSVSVAYSVKDLQFGFGEPQIGVSLDNKLVFSLPINVTNKSYYSIGVFNVTSIVLDEGGSILTLGSSVMPLIEKDQAVTFFHNLTLDISNLLQRNQNYLFNDTQLRIVECVSMRLAEIIPVQASGNFSIPWGAPLHNFALEQPTFPAFNLTHIQVEVRLTFENHASFGFSGIVRIRMYNNGGVLAGSGDTAISVPQNSHYKGSIEFWVMASAISSTGRLEIELQTPSFSYGPQVIAYG